MATKIDITESEWKVMQVLWQNESLELGDICKALEGQVEWSNRTIQTLIRRLAGKGAVGIQKGRYYKYYPLVEENDCLKQEMKGILSRLFYSSPNRLMATLVESEELTDEDINEMMQLLKDIKKERG